MNEKNKHINSLQSWAQFSLFITSYAPLFALIVLKQLYTNSAFLSWGGFSIKSIVCFFEKFGLSAVLILIGTFGLYGAKQTIKNIKGRAINGFPVKVADVKNKNSESVNYIATYIIPFAFQSFGSWFELVAILVIVVIIYRIFVNSTLILVNPILSLKYGLYEIEYLEGEKTKSAMVLSEDKFLVENENIKIYPIGHKMFYAINS